MPGIGIGISTAFAGSQGVSGPTLPAAPTGLTATAVSPSQIDLAWNASDGATGYKIERGTNGVDFVLIDTVGEVVAYEDTGLAAGTYYYRIAATNAAGDSDYSNTANADNRSYAQILVEDYGAAEVWPLVDMTDGTLLAPIHAYVNGNRDGRIERGAFDVQNTAGPVAGTLAPFLDGTNDVGNLLTSNGTDGWVDVVNFNEFSFFVWAKAENAGVWNSGTRWILRLDFGASDLCGLYAPGGNILRWIRRQNGTTVSIDLTSMTNTDWFSAGFSASVAANEWKAFYNGAQQGTTQTGLVSRAVTANTAILGAVNLLATPGQPWQGWLAYVAIGTAGQ